MKKNRRMPSTLPTLLRSALKANQHTTVGSVQQQQLIHYLLSLQKWNRVFNLTRLCSIHDLIYLHLMDSLSIYPYLTGPLCLDVGSGGGFPGLALAITYPHYRWILIDKNNKKTRFLTQMVAELGLKQVTISYGRVERLSLIQPVNNIVSRAFGTLCLLVKTTVHLLNKESNSQWIAMKGQYPTAELAHLPTTVQASVIPLFIHGLTVTRHIVCLQPALK